MKYYDIHTHHLPRRLETDTSYILNWIIRTGEREDVFEPAHPNVFYSAGIHPWYIDQEQLSDQLLLLRQSAADAHVIAIGEAGLDKLTQAPWTLQVTLFEEHISLAKTYEKPLVIHCVKAWSEVISLHKKHRPQQPWIIHGFRGNAILAAQLLRQGLYLSFSDRFNPAALTPQMTNRLFLETDDQKPEIYRVYTTAARHLNTEPEQLATTIAANVKSVFRI